MSSERTDDSVFDDIYFAPPDTNAHLRFSVSNSLGSSLSWRVLSGVTPVSGCNGGPEAITTGTVIKTDADCVLSPSGLRTLEITTSGVNCSTSVKTFEFGVRIPEIVSIQLYPETDGSAGFNIGNHFQAKIRRPSPYATANLAVSTASRQGFVSFSNVVPKDTDTSKDSNTEIWAEAYWNKNNPTPLPCGPIGSYKIQYYSIVANSFSLAPYPFGQSPHDISYAGCSDTHNPTGTYIYNAGARSVVGTVADGDISSKVPTYIGVYLVDEGNSTNWASNLHLLGHFHATQGCTSDYTGNCGGYSVDLRTITTNTLPAETKNWIQTHTNILPVCNGQSRKIRVYSINEPMPKAFHPANINNQLIDTITINCVP